MRAKRVLLPPFSLILLRSNYPKSLPFALKSTLAIEIHRVMLSAPLFVAAVSFFVACVEFQVGVLAPEESLGVKSSPARIDNSAFLRLLFCLHKKSLEIHR